MISLTGATSARNQGVRPSEIPSAWALAGLALVVLALWILIHPFRGIAHDGQIYTFFSMARLYPTSLGHDFFVRFGTQNHYTIFGPLYAGLIQMLGIDPAAAVVTFVTQVAFYAAALHLARYFVPAYNAVFSVGLLVVLPAWYGANLVFSHTELFATPRQPAEGCVLLAIAFILRGSRMIAAGCLVVAILLHPIIAGAGLMFWIALEFSIPHPKLTVAVAAGALVLLCLLAWLPGVLTHFDQEWFDILTSRLKYLFPTRWAASDWAHSVPAVATLIVGVLCGRQDAVRRVSIAVLITAAAGLALTIVGGDLLHVTFASQLQGWRWLWLASALSPLLLALILNDCWNLNDLGRSTALLLIATWLPVTTWLRIDLPMAYLAAAFACLCALCAGKAIDSRYQRIVLMGSWAVLALAGVLYAAQLGETLHQAQIIKHGNSHLATLINQAQVLAEDSVLSTGLLTLIWIAGTSATPRISILLSLLGASMILVLAPGAVSTWTHKEYTTADAAAFEPWRLAIPEGAEVLWPDDVPDRAWYSLHRASYWSLLQMAGMVFSRQDTMIGIRREDAVATLVEALGGKTNSFLRAGNMKPVQVQEDLCAVPDLHYYVSRRDLGPTPYSSVTLRHGDRIRTLYLYHCDARQSVPDRTPPSASP